MLSEKQFRERAKIELRQIGSQVLSLATDRDIYWKLEREIIQPNPQLCEARSAFLDMLRGCYADALAARLLRLLRGEEGGLSLPRVLAQLAEYPQLLHGQITERELADDRAALTAAAAGLQGASAPRVGHHERTLSALAATQRELDSAIDRIISTVKTYYWIVTETHLDLDVKHPEDPLSIFQFAWATPVLAK
jgi:predicted component of type VI protein secretion system